MMTEIPVALDPRCEPAAFSNEMLILGRGQGVIELTQITSNDADQSATDVTGRVKGITM